MLILNVVKELKMYIIKLNKSVKNRCKRYRCYLEYFTGTRTKQYST